MRENHALALIQVSGHRITNALQESRSIHLYIDSRPVWWYEARPETIIRQSDVSVSVNWAIRSARSQGLCLDWRSLRGLSLVETAGSQHGWLAS